MKEGSEMSVDELAAHVGGQVIGDGNILIKRVASLESAGDHEITYVEDEKFFAAGDASKASCVIVPLGADVKTSCRIEVTKPKLAFALIASLLHPQKSREPSVHATAVIVDSADVALTAYIGPHVSIGENTGIGAGTRIEAGVVIGDNVAVGV